MKTFLLYIFCVVLLSCSSEKSQINTIRSNVEKYLKDHGYAGDDYAFVAITAIDTVTEKEFLDRQMESLTLPLMGKEQRLRRMDSLEVVFKKALSLHPNDQTLITNLQDITRGKTLLYVHQHKLDSLKATSKPEQAQNVKFIGLDFSCTSKGPGGTTVQHHFYVKLDEQLNVLSASDLQQ